MYLRVATTRLCANAPMLFQQHRGRALPALKLPRNSQTHYTTAHDGVGEVRISPRAC